MKIKIQNYSFNKTAKTVTFSDYSNIRLDGILLVTNVTSNIIIYNFADPLLGGTVSGNVLTLTYDTSLMANTDKLQIFYDNGEVAENEVIEQLQELRAKIPKLLTRPIIDQLMVVTDGNSTLYNYEYLNTSGSAKTMLWEGQQQTQQLHYLHRPLIGF